MLKKKSGSKSHLLFKLSSNAKDKSRKREYNQVFEEYENEGRGMVIDMKAEKGFKMVSPNTSRHNISFKGLCKRYFKLSKLIPRKDH